MAQTGRRLNAGGNRHGGGLRDRSSGHQKRGGGHLRVARARPHRAVQAAVAMAARSNGNGDKCGGRSSVVHGRRAMARPRGNQVARPHLGGPGSTVDSTAGRGKLSGEQEVGHGGRRPRELVGRWLEEASERGR